MLIADLAVRLPRNHSAAFRIARVNRLFAAFDRSPMPSPPVMGEPKQIDRPKPGRISFTPKLGRDRSTAAAQSRATLTAERKQDNHQQVS